jgi:hypothetical protein
LPEVGHDGLQEGLALGAKAAEAIAAELHHVHLETRVHERFQVVRYASREHRVALNEQQPLRRHRVLTGSRPGQLVDQKRAFIDRILDPVRLDEDPLAHLRTQRSQVVQPGRRNAAEPVDPGFLRVCTDGAFQDARAVVLRSRRGPRQQGSGGKPCDPSRHGNLSSLGARAVDRCGRRRRQGSRIGYGSAADRWPAAYTHPAAPKAGGGIDRSTLTRFRWTQRDQAFSKLFGGRGSGRTVS